AIRFDAAAAGAAMPALVAPPYDVIDAARRDKLAAMSPYNVVRIDLPEKSEFPGAKDIYAASAGLFEKWQAAGVLKTDPQPGVYLYSQQFRLMPGGPVFTRTGILCALRNERYGGSILPHERTLRGPKLDRLNLMRATESQLSPIFLIAPDEGGISQWIAAAGKPAAGSHFTAVAAKEDLAGPTTETLTPVFDPEQIGALEKLIAARKLYIADGHHRYETSIAYRDERYEKLGGAADEKGPVQHPWDLTLAMIVPQSDPGLVILPTHRLLHDVPPEKIAGLLEKLEANFTVTPSDAATIAKIGSEPPVGPMKVGLAVPGGTHSAPPRCFVVTLKNAEAMAQRCSDRKPAWRALDLAVLHTLILEDLCGIDAVKLEKKTNIAYIQDPRVAAGSPGNVHANYNVQAAMIVRPTSLTQLFAVADAGEVMPQKSTFFYPKLVTGHVIYSVKE
ncbi:MAG: DUF1015 domain-containing protein, partial [Planctomycetota bacterium]